VTPFAGQGACSGGLRDSMLPDVSPSASDREPPARAVNLQDIADRAGVSLATASRVLGNGSRRVTDELIERVTRAAAELGYSANLSARTVATGHSSIVGVLVHDISDPYFSTIAAAVAQRADRDAAVVSIGNAFGDAARELAYVSMMRSMRARALVIAGSRSDDRGGYQALRDELEAFERGGGRAVCIGQPLLGIDTVAPENEAGAEALAVALVAAGHRDFAVLAGPPHLHTARDRLRGFRAGLEKAGIALGERDVITGEFNRDGGFEALATLLSRSAGAPPGCVFAVNDVMAVGALACLRTAGLDVPGDVAVAGFDDIVTLRDVWPRLTTVRLPLEAIGEMVGRLALDQEHDEAPRLLRVQGEVILRESTAFPAGRVAS
jgi:LacI family transcriptional regulator